MDEKLKFIQIKNPHQLARVFRFYRICLIELDCSAKLFSRRRCKDQ
jgi:hypothetical protein